MRRKQQRHLGPAPGWDQHASGRTTIEEQAEVDLSSSWPLTRTGTRRRRCRLSTKMVASPAALRKRRPSRSERHVDSPIAAPLRSTAFRVAVVRVGSDATSASATSAGASTVAPAGLWSIAEATTVDRATPRASQNAAATSGNRSGCIRRLATRNPTSPAIIGRIMAADDGGPRLAPPGDDAAADDGDKQSGAHNAQLAEELDELIVRVLRGVIPPQLGRRESRGLLEEAADADAKQRRFARHLEPDPGQLLPDHPRVVAGGVSGRARVPDDQRRADHQQHGQCCDRSPPASSAGARTAPDIPARR